MKIVWSDLAKEYYIKIIQQLIEKWNITIVERFDNEIIELVIYLSLTIFALNLKSQAYINA